MFTLIRLDVRGVAGFLLTLSDPDLEKLDGLLLSIVLRGLLEFPILSDDLPRLLFMFKWLLLLEVLEGVFLLVLMRPEELDFEILRLLLVLEFDVILVCLEETDLPDPELLAGADLDGCLLLDLVLTGAGCVLRTTGELDGRVGLL